MGASAEALAGFEIVIGPRRRPILRYTYVSFHVLINNLFYNSQRMNVTVSNVTHALSSLVTTRLPANPVVQQYHPDESHLATLHQSLVLITFVGAALLCAVYLVFLKVRTFSSYRSTHKGDLGHVLRHHV